MEYLYINNQNSVAVTYNPESIVEDIYINGKKHDFKEENEIRSIIYKNSQEAGLQIPFNFKGFVSRVVLNPKSNDQQKDGESDQHTDQPRILFGLPVLVHGERCVG